MSDTIYTQVNVTFKNQTGKPQNIVPANYIEKNEHHGKFISGPEGQLNKFKGQACFTVQHSTWDQNGSTGWVKYTISNGPDLYIYYNYPLIVDYDSYSASRMYFYVCIQPQSGANGTDYFAEIEGVNMTPNEEPAPAVGNDPDWGKTPMNVVVTLRRFI